jgi:two-component system, LytTR family, response regulator
MRVLIVDDEPLARERLRDLLENDAEVEIVGECADGPSAVTAIRSREPDLVFLDVKMPGHDGFRVVEEVGADRMPVTVFVTAFDKFALKAFEVRALDYLLKPFDRDRFEAALGRAKEQFRRRQEEEVRDRLDELLTEVRGERKPLERIAVKSSGSVYFLRAEEIDWVEAAGNYSRLHVGKTTHLLRETMTALESKLDPKRFLRIHRSTIVNIERVRELQPYFHGDYIVLLDDGTELTLSRNYRQRLHEVFGDPF